MNQRRPPEPVYIPLYPRDFLSSNSVDAMTTEEVGAYLLLMMRSWSETPPATLPTDDATLARMARMTPARWAKAKDKVLKPWEIRDDRWVQPRLQVEYHKSVGIAELRSKSARVAAQSRWSSNADAMRDASATHPPSNANAMRGNAMQGRAGQLHASSSTASVSAVDSICDAIEAGFVGPKGEKLTGVGEMSHARKRLEILLADPWREGTCADFAPQLVEVIRAERFASVTGAVRFIESVCRRCRRDGCLPGDPMKGGKGLRIEREGGGRGFNGTSQTGSNAATERRAAKRATEFAESDRPLPVFDPGVGEVSRAI